MLKKKQQPKNTFIQGTAANVIHPTSIVLAGTGIADQSTAPDSFVVKPVRGVTGAPAALYYDSTTGEISYGTSSLRFKTDVEPVTREAARAVLDLRPVTFRAKEDSAAARTDKKRIYGFIAEEVAAVDPLLAFSSRDPVTGLERIEGVHYDRVAPLLVRAVRDLRDEVEALREELGELRAEVGRLRPVAK